MLHVLQIISDTKVNADARVRDEQRALTEAKQAKEYGDSHVCDAEQRALSESKHATRII